MGSIPIRSTNKNQVELSFTDNSTWFIFLSNNPILDYAVTVKTANINNSNS